MWLGYKYLKHLPIFYIIKLTIYIWCLLIEEDKLIKFKEYKSAIGYKIK